MFSVLPLKWARRLTPGLCTYCVWSQLWSALEGRMWWNLLFYWPWGYVLGITQHPPSAVLGGTLVSCLYYKHLCFCTELALSLLGRPMCHRMVAAFACVECGLWAKADPCWSLSPLALSYPSHLSFSSYILIDALKRWLYGHRVYI